MTFEQWWELEANKGFLLGMKSVDKASLKDLCRKAWNEAVVSSLQAFIEEEKQRNPAAPITASALARMRAY